MPRARTREKRTAAVYEYEGSGCAFGFLLPPLSVLLIGSLLGFFAIHSPVQATSLPMTADSTTVLAPLFTPEVQYWSASIIPWAAAAGVDPNLAAVVMQIESCGDPRALSSAGAMGLFQVMPFHFFVADNPFDPDTNARRGLDYLKRAWDSTDGDVRLALAGYNGGLGVINRMEGSWPAETIRYAYWGSGIFEDARKGSPQSARLNDWLNAGGASLCNRARLRLGLL